MAMDDLRILRLEAENVKRIKVVEITPKGELVTITGKNGQGKTSVLDCILWALDGTSSIQWKPIRDGEERGFIQLDIGNDEGLKLQVTRRFNAKEDIGLGDGKTYTTSLKVVNEDGFRPDGEQTLLSSLVGALSFDPGEFMRAKPEEQVKLLKGLIPEADFDGIARDRKKAYDERTDVNREEKRLRASATAIPAEELAPLPKVDTVESLMDQLSSIGEEAREYEAELSRRRNLAGYRDTAFQTRDAKRGDAEELRRQAADLDASADEYNRVGVGYEEEISQLEELVQPADPAEIRTKLDSVQALVRRHEVQRERADLVKKADDQKAASEALSLRIERLDKDVVDLIAGADLPVRGLAIQEDMVFLRGVPFNQASDAEQLRAALAMGMAANPKLRVIRIRDGSLLDDDAMQVIREVAEEERFQIWLERVGSGDGPDEIVMEAGEVKQP